MQDNYLRAMKADKHLAKDYYAKSINKTEQQKALESLLLDSINKGELDRNAPLKIADLACGGGTLSYHLSSFFPNASFVLLDYNEDGLELAKEINAESKHRMEFIQGDLRDLPFEDSSFDLVFCWQTLGWVAKESIACVMQEILRILKPQGQFYASSLFNTEFDVDLYTTICDRTRPSSYNQSNPKEPLTNGYYNTYCKQSIVDICGEGVQCVRIVPFYPQVDFKRDFSQKGIGSFTLAIDSAESNCNAFWHLEAKRESTSTKANCSVKHNGNKNQASATRGALGDTLGFAQNVKSKQERSDNSERNITGGGAKHNSHTISTQSLSHTIQPNKASPNHFRRNAAQLGDFNHYKITPLTQGGVL